MEKYEHLFFDLDHTLWDYERNASETLCDIHNRFGIKRIIPDETHFCNRFLEINDELWVLFRENKISKERLNLHRFELLLKDGITDEQLLNEISQYFIDHCPQKPHLIPGAKSILDYLEAKNRYHLHIITNGHTKMQMQKLEHSGILHYFEKIFTSESVGYKKPQRRYFEYAIKSCNASKKKSLVIGDNYEADILGAKAFGVDQLFYNPTPKKYPINATYEVADIGVLKDLL